MRSTFLKNEVVMVSALIFATWAALAGSTFFWEGSGEHDTFMMAAGVVHGVTTGQIINSMNYGSDLQFMFYFVLHYLARLFAMDGHAMLLVMNCTGTVLALLIPFLLFFLLRRDDISSDVSPSLAVLLLITSPTYAFMVPYGHPFHAAFAISLFSILLFRRFATALQLSRRFLLLTAAILLQGIALTIRAEQVGLFWFCLIGLFIYEQEKSREKWLWLFVLFASSVLIFIVMHHFMVTLVRGAPEVAASAPTSLSVWEVIYNHIRLVRSTYAKADISRALAYHVTDIGVPLLAMAGFFFLKQLSGKQFRPVLALIISVGPSLLVYLVNMSPPRHLVITVIGLAIYIGASARSIESTKLIPLGATVLAANLLIPPLLSVVDPGGAEGQRRNYTYNVIQRYDRNREQTKAAMQFFPRVLSEAPTQTVIFGNWIHIAQVSLLMSGEQRLRFASVELAPSIRALSFSFREREIYLIEAYDHADVQRSVTTLGNFRPQLRFLSLLPGSAANDLGISVPREIGWWSV